MTAGRGHNGGPPLDDGAGGDLHPACSRCRFWQPPHTGDVDAYRRFEMGYGRRVKKPAGYCDNQTDRKPGSHTRVSGATPAHFYCRNFSAAPPHAPVSTRGQGFITIYKNDQVAWQGHAADLPAWALDDDPT